MSAIEIAAGEMHGLWGLPRTTPDLRGRLTTIDGRERLQLEDPLPVSSSQPDITIVGRLLDGRDVTLLDCDLATRIMGKRDPYADEWHVGRKLIGIQLYDDQHPAFTGFRVELNGLAEAIGLSGLSITSSDLTSAQNKHVAVEWEEPPPIVARFGGADLTLRSLPRVAIESDFHFAITNRASAELIADAPISLSEAERSVDDLISLVALATECATGVQQLELHPITGSENVSVGVRGRAWYGADPATEDPRFALADLGDDAPIVIAGFERFRRDQPEAAELLFEYQAFATAMTPPDRFLYLARFLEAYHRRDSGLRDHHFVKRATALLSSPAAQPARPAFGAPAADLAEVVKNTRNYYVHYDPRMHAKAHHDIQLDDLADRVWCAIRSVLWSELGMPAATIERILETDWRFMRATQKSL